MSMESFVSLSDTVIPTVLALSYEIMQKLKPEYFLKDHKK